MSEMGPPLPQNCAGCSYFAEGELCRRHAPSPGTESFELTWWPKVKKIDRCGSGAAVGEDDGKQARITRCESCLHWFQPGGVGIKPDYRQGRPEGFWRQSGYCTRFAPSPSSEDGRKTLWRCTSAGDGCGDGQAVQQDEDEDGGDLTPTNADHSTGPALAHAGPLPALP